MSETELSASLKSTYCSRKVCQRLAVHCCLLLQLFLSRLLSPPDVYLFSALGLDAEHNRCLQEAWKTILPWVLRNGHSKDAKDELKDSTTQ